MPEVKKHSIFISYRRRDGATMAQLIYNDLCHRGYEPFYDRQSLKTGRFDEKILAEVRACTDIIVILSKNALVQRGADEDWYWKEIRTAMESGCNIVPIYAFEFEMPSGEEQKKLPQFVQDFLNYTGYRMDFVYYDACMDHLCKMLRSAPKQVFFVSDFYSACQVVEQIFQNQQFLLSAPPQSKENWMRKMLSASTEPSCADMAMSQIKPFLYNSVNLRTAFNYSVSLRPGNLFEKFFGAEPGRYFTVQEKLEFKKHYTSGALPGTLRVGFTVHFNELDSMLRDEEFFFSESLILAESEMQALLAMPQEEKQKFYKNVMKVQLRVNGEALSPTRIQITSQGIFADYEPPCVGSKDADVKIFFYMPRLRKSGIFLMSISEPCYNPKLSFSNQDHEAKITAIPLLNSKISSDSMTVFESELETEMENEWILPVSGVIYLIELQK